MENSNNLIHDFSSTCINNNKTNIINNTSSPIKETNENINSSYTLYNNKSINLSGNSKEKENETSKLVELKHIIEFTRGKIYYLISAFIIIASIFVCYSYILYFILGIIFTIIIEFITIFYFFGLGISDYQYSENNENFATMSTKKIIDTNKNFDANINANDMSNQDFFKEYNTKPLSDEQGQALIAEEKNNDVKITYKTLNKKSTFPGTQDKSLPIAGEDNIQKIELDLKHIDFDAHCYCHCKFLPENFEKLIKMQNDVINNYSDSTVNK